MSMDKMRKLMAAMAAVLAMPAAADFDAAMQRYDKGEWQPAHAEFRRLAELGQHAAQFNLGVMYCRGEHVGKNAIECYAWMTLACQGHDKEWAAVRDKVYSSLDAAGKAAADARGDALLKEFGDAALAERLAPVLVQNVDNSQELKVVRRVSPEYPMEALSKGRVGWVDVIFTVAKDGTTRNHGLVSFSHDVFVDSTIKAIKQWRYQPIVVNGKPVEVYGQDLRILFQIRETIFNRARVLAYSEELRSKAEQGNALDQYKYAYSLDLLPSYSKVEFDGGNAGQWYLRSASSGFGPAQFELGKKLLYGKGCTVDSAKSMAWLERAASQGQVDAQYLLAIEMLSGARLARDERAARTWLEKAAVSDHKAKVKLAWMLSTHPDKSLRDGNRAQTYLEQVDDAYFDRLSVYETQAAVAAEQGNFDKAVKWQKEAYEEAERYKLPLEQQSARLAAYQQRQAWTEEP